MRIWVEERQKCRSYGHQTTANIPLSDLVLLLVFGSGKTMKLVTNLTLFKLEVVDETG
jgi:hypothetical protein